MGLQLGPEKILNAKTANWHSSVIEYMPIEILIYSSLNQIGYQIWNYYTYLT
jgi:hypothetical protein